MRSIVHLSFCYFQEVLPLLTDRSITQGKIFSRIAWSKTQENPVECLIKLPGKKDRSKDYLVVKAILEYLKREEAKG